MNIAGLFLRAGRTHADLPGVVPAPNVLLSYGQVLDIDNLQPH
jgi:hypothetical protein